MAAKRPASAAPGVAEAVAYAEAVVADRTPAGRLARLACERFLRDKAAADAGAGPWGFDPDLVEAALLFAGQMPNIKGPEAGRPLRLIPSALDVDACPGAGGDRGDPLWHAHKPVPGVAAGVHDGVVAVPHAVAE